MTVTIVEYRFEILNQIILDCFAAACRFGPGIRSRGRGRGSRQPTVELDGILSRERGRLATEGVHGLYPYLIPAVEEPKR